MKGVYLVRRYHLVLLWGVVLFAFVMGAYRLATIPRIATVDLTGIANQAVRRLVNVPLTTQGRQARIKVFSRELESELTRYAKTHRVVLVPKEAVIAGAPDVTDKIVRELQQAQGDVYETHKLS